MEIKGVSIQNEENYYKILSVIKNKKNTTVKEIEILNSFLRGKETKEKSIDSLLEPKTKTNEKILFSAIRGLVLKEGYSFFRMNN